MHVLTKQNKKILSRTWMKHPSALQASRYERWRIHFPAAIAARYFSLRSGWPTIMCVQLGSKLCRSSTTPPMRTRWKTRKKRKSDWGVWGSFRCFITAHKLVKVKTVNWWFKYCSFALAVGPKPKASAEMRVCSLYTIILQPTKEIWRLGLNQVSYWSIKFRLCMTL